MIHKAIIEELVNYITCVCESQNNVFDFLLCMHILISRYVYISATHYEIKELYIQIESKNN